MRPERYARTLCPLSNSTLNWVLGNSSVMVPSTSNLSFCAIPNYLYLLRRFRMRRHLPRPWFLLRFLGGLFRLLLRPPVRWQRLLRLLPRPFRFLPFPPLLFQRRRLALQPLALQLKFGLRPLLLRRQPRLRLQLLQRLGLVCATSIRSVRWRLQPVS